MIRAKRHPACLIRAKLNDRRIGLHISALREAAYTTLISDRNLDPTVLIERLMMVVLRFCRAIGRGYPSD